MDLSIRMGAQVEAMMQKLAVVGTPMPRMMQQNMVRNRATMAWPPESFTTMLMSLEPRPVEVTHPATRPAMEQATATVMVLLAPASSASMNFENVRLSDVSPVFDSLLIRLFAIPTTMVTTMAIAADACMEFLPVETRYTRMTSGSSR